MLPSTRLLSTRLPSARLLSTRTSFAIAALVVTLLLLASFGAAGSFGAASNGTPTATQPQPAGDLALAERVVLPNSSTSGSAVVGPHVSGALDRSVSRMEGAYDRYLLEERLARTDRGDAKRTILNRSVDEMEASVDRLRQREASARLAYHSGDIGIQEYLAILRSISDQADQLDMKASLIAPSPTDDADGLADSHDAPTAANRISGLRDDIALLHGPVRGAIGESVSGETNPRRFYVTGSQRGTVISMLTDGVYQRVTIRPELLTNSTRTGISLSEANDLARNELYPVSVEHYRLTRRITSVSPGNLYLVTAEGQFDTERATLQSYIDATSANVFWESHRIEVGSGIPLSPPLTNGSGDLNVTVRPTFATGPAAVNVTIDGTPAANVSVSVDGTVVTRTDDDGRAWIVLPNDSPTVSVSRGTETVRVPVEWDADGVVTGENQTST